MTVRVIGWGKALRIVLEDVFVSAELMYQTRQRTWAFHQRVLCRHCAGEVTMSFTETGAFKASAISAALAVTLPFLVLIVLIASLMLFCRPCLDGVPVI